MMMKRIFFKMACLALFWFPYPLAAQMLPMRFTASEGTWIALDVDAQGETIAFELLGDLYALPINGGTAQCIASGRAFQSQPRFSPDGQQIAFVSDANGSDNLWIMDSNGKHARQLTHRSSDIILSPEWNPSGKSIYYTVMTDGWSRKTTIYELNLDSGEEQLVFDNANGPSSMLVSAPPPGPYTGSVHPNGTSILFSSITPRSHNQRSGPKSEILQFSFAEKSVVKLPLEGRNAMKPLWSRNGKWLAYAAEKSGVTGLKLRDMQTGSEKWLVFPLQRNELEARATRDVLPNFCFTPDHEALIIAFNGKIHQIQLDDASAKEIPFTATVNLDIVPTLHFQHQIPEDSLIARFVQQPAVSRSGKLAFSTLGRIYIRNTPADKPIPVSPPNTYAFFPAWAPDDAFLVFCTWDASGGALWQYVPGELPRKITRENGFFAEPAVSADGKKIVAIRAPEGLKRSTRFRAIPDAAEFVVIDLQTGHVLDQMPSNGYLHPRFTDHPEAITAVSPAKGWILKEKGKPDRLILKSTIPAKDLKVSDNGTKMLLLTPDGKLFSSDLPEKILLDSYHEPVEVNPLANGQLLSEALPEAFAFAEGASTAIWTAGNKLSWHSDTSIHTDTLQIKFPRERTGDRLLLRGGTCLTMNGKEVLENADLLIVHNRIAKIGPKGSFTLPEGTTILDVSGKFLLPGFIDLHAHLYLNPEVLEPENPAMLANLAFGTTTVRDPQATPDVFAYADLIASGRAIGPRIFSTGPGLFSWDGLNSFEKLKARLEVYKYRYQTDYIKSYLIGTRQQREWMVRACRELELMPTAEGGADTKQNITHAMDGFSGNEHSLPLANLYDDVVQLFAGSQIVYTPTLLVTFGGPLPIYRLLAEEKPLDNPRLRRFFPEEELYEKSATRLLFFRPDDYHVTEVAQSTQKIAAAGGKIGLGGHGEMQGLQNHWEMWLLASGGMDAYEVLRTATLNGAQALGLEKDLGSLVAGKLADVLILDQNPLENIRHSTSIRYVIKNGILYDAETLNEQYPIPQVAPKTWWQLPQNTRF